MMRLVLFFVLMVSLVSSVTWAAILTPPSTPNSILPDDDESDDPIIFPVGNGTTEPSTTTPSSNTSTTAPTSTGGSGTTPSSTTTVQASPVTLGFLPTGAGGFMHIDAKRRVILESIQEIANAIDARLARANQIFYEASGGFIVIFVAIYILYQAGKMLFPFFPLDRVSSVMNATFTRILLAVTVTMFTASAMGPWNNFIAPIMVSGINYASELLFTAVCTIQTSNASGSTPIAIEGVTCRGENATVDGNREPRLFNTTDPETIGQSIQRLFGWIEQSILTMVGGAVKALIFGPDGQFGWNDTMQATTTWAVLIFMALALAITGLMPYFTLGMRFVFFMFGGMILAIMTYFAGIALVIPAFTSFVGFWLRAILQLAVEIVMIAFAIAVSLATMNEALINFQQTNQSNNFAPTHDIFITLWGIFFIMNMLVKSAKTLAAALTSGGGKGLDLDAGAEMAEKVQQEAENMIKEAQQKGKEGLHFAYSK
jgi:hypothetical protein